MGETVEQLMNRFWKNIYKDNNSGCWIWIGYKDNNGYGRFSIINRPHLAHRVAYYMHTKDLPKFPYHVLHRCNNRSCVNPLHLYKGTDKDNKQDQIDKDGVRSGGQKKKLSSEDRQMVVSLTLEGKTQKEIAKIFSVSQWNIWNVLNDIEWE